MQPKLAPHCNKEYSSEIIEEDLSCILPPGPSESDAMAIAMRFYRGAVNPEAIRLAIKQWIKSHAA